MALHHKKDPNRHKGKIKAVALSTAIGMGLFYGQSTANAVGIGDIFGSIGSSISGFISQGISKKNGETIADRIVVASSQTAIAPSEISEMMQASNKAYATTYLAENSARRIKKVFDGMTFAETSSFNPETGDMNPPVVNSGLSSGLNCEALAEKTIIQSKQKINEAERYNVSRRLAQRYTYGAGDKQANRVSSHLDKYCDVTEASNNICPLSIGMGSADSTYATISETDVLSNDGVDASMAFVLNVIDPASTKVEGCNQDVCNTVTAVNTSYQALANVSQGAFVNQINDRLYYEYHGSKAGAELGKSTNIKVEGGGGGVSQPTQPTTPTPNNDETTGGTIYLGDSIANGYRKAGSTNGKLLAGNTQDGKQPSAILNDINANLATNPDFYKGKTVVISTGYSNNTNGLNDIDTQIKKLTQGGAKVTILGVANQYNKAGKTGQTMNNDLSNIAKKYGANFTGGFNAGSDNTHPDKYTNLNIH